MAKTVVTIEDTRSAAGGEGRHGMKMMVDGKEVDLMSCGGKGKGFDCSIENGEALHFSDEQIVDMLHEELN